jgi:hypothetical protein
VAALEGKGELYYAILLISCRQRHWTLPSWSGKNQAVTESAIHKDVNDSANPTIF